MIVAFFLFFDVNIYAGFCFYVAVFAQVSPGVKQDGFPNSYYIQQ